MFDSARRNPYKIGQSMAETLQLKVCALVGIEWLKLPGGPKASNCCDLACQKRQGFMVSAFVARGLEVRVSVRRLRGGSIWGFGV